MAFWAAFVGCGLGCVLLAYLGGRRRRLRPVDLTNDEQAVECAACGYDVRGLPGHVCPECGGDLDVIGRVTPQFRKWQKVPPLLRAGVWTLGVAALAAICLAFASVGELPTRAQWRMAATFSNPGEFYTITILRSAEGPRLIVGDYPWSLGDDVLARLKPSERITLVGHTGLSRRSAAAVTLTWDVTADTWRVTRAGQELDAGSGPPTPEAVLRLVEFTRRAAPPTRPATSPIESDEMGGVATVQGPPQASAGLLHRELTFSTAEHMRAMSEDERQGYGRWHERLPAGWTGGLPPGLFDLMNMGSVGGTTTYGRPSVMSSTFGGDGSNVAFVRTWLASAVGFWVVVWLAGLPFVLRRRAVSPRRHGDTEAGADI